MEFFKKNIWYLFYIIAFFTTILSIAISYTLWQYAFSKQKLKQESIVLLYSNSVYSVLSQYETVFEMLGVCLFKDGKYKNIKHTKKRFDRLLKLSPTIAGLGIVEKDGNTLASSIDTDIKKLPNMLELKETRDSFLQALSSYDMVLGRTHYHELLDMYVIPLKKAVRDESGGVLGVVVATVEVQGNFNIKQKNIFDGNIVIVRESDNFRQMILKKITAHDRYDEPVSDELISGFLKIIAKTYDLTEDEIKKSEEVFTVIQAKITKEKEEVMRTIFFIEKYQLWVVVESSFDSLKESFYKKLLLIIFSFLLFMAILYALFRQIDISESKKREALTHQAEHDYLTKLKNRYYLSKKFNHKELLRPFGLIVLNIDNFKTINRNLDYSCGDMVLLAFSLRLSEIKKQDDILARYGGDEFLFIRYGATIGQMIQLAKDILVLFREPFVVRGVDIVLGASMGVSNYPSDGKNFDEIKKYADMALQEAKKEKNCYKIFKDNIKQKHLRVSMIEQELKVALEHNEIYMVYQPQIKSDDTLYGVEALVRWESRVLGFVGPDEFIQIAERTGVMVKLGQYIINTSLKEIVSLQQQTEKKLQLSINISVKQLMESSFYENLLRSIKNTGFQKTSLMLEVTESLFIENQSEVFPLLKKIRAEGIKISLDDFGIGYSSLSLLRKLPIDELKIDKSFIDDLEYDTDAVNMIKMIISVGKQLDIELLTEGVEKQEQKDMLNSYGCNLYQGYYFSKPLKREDLLDFLR